MNLAQAVLAAMRAANCTPEQIGTALLSIEDKPSSGAARQARYRVRERAKKEAASIVVIESEIELDNVTPNVTVTQAITSDVTSDVTVTVTSDAKTVTPRVHAGAPVLCGAERSILPLENATHSIPKAEAAKPPSRKPKAAATQLAIDFVLTPPMRNHGRRHGLSDRENDQLGETMRDWSMGKGIARPDWEATYRTFVRKYLADSPARAGPLNGHVPKTNAQFDVILESIKDERSGISYDKSSF